MFVNGVKRKKSNKGLHFYRTYVTIVSVKDYYKTEGGTFMAQDKLTAKQQEILEYIKNTILKKGYPPAVRDICVSCEIQSPLLLSILICQLWKKKDISIVILPSREQLRSWMILLILTGKKW